MYSERLYPVDPPIQVLHVEDNPIYTEVVKDELEVFLKKNLSDSHKEATKLVELTTANSKDEALLILDKKYQDFDLIVIDLHLGGPDFYEGFGIIEEVISIGIRNGINLPWMIYATFNEDKKKYITKNLKRCLSREDIDEIEYIYIGKSIDSTNYNDLMTKKPTIELSHAFRKMLFDRTFVASKTSGQYFSICNLSNFGYNHQAGDFNGSLFLKIPQKIEKSVKPRPDFYFIGCNRTCKECKESKDGHIFTERFLPELLKFKTFSLRNMPYGRLDRVLIVPGNRGEINDSQIRANCYLLPSIQKHCCSGHEHLLFLTNRQDSRKYFSIGYFPLLNAIFLFVNINDEYIADDMSILNFSRDEINFVVEMIDNFKKHISLEVYNKCIKIVFCHYDIFQEDLNQPFCEHLIKERFLTLIYGHSEFSNRINFDSINPEDIVKWESPSKIPRISCGSLDIAKCVTPWFTILNIITNPKDLDNFNFSFIEYKVLVFNNNEWDIFENDNSIKINEKILETLDAYIAMHSPRQRIRKKQKSIPIEDTNFPIWWDSQVSDDEKFTERLEDLIKFLHNTIVTEPKIKIYLKTIKYNKYMQDYIELDSLYGKFKNILPGRESEENLAQLKLKYISIVQNVKRDSIYAQILKGKES
jgi:CheY-like chemotaxis protein